MYGNVVYACIEKGPLEAICKGCWDLASQLLPERGSKRWGSTYTNHAHRYKHENTYIYIYIYIYMNLLPPSASVSSVRGGGVLEPAH